MKKRILGVLFSLALMIGMMPVLSQPANAEDYWQVTLSGGDNSTYDGDISQSVVKGSTMSTVSYTAKEGYIFEDFDDIEDHGVTATRKDEDTVIVSGEPSDDVNIQVPNAVIAYPVWVGGTHVTETNKDDVLKGTENEGKVSFTPADGETPAKLTLKGANITKGYYYMPGTACGIYYEGSENEPLIIVSPSGSVNKIISSESERKFSTGIRSIYEAAITLSGNGKLTTEGSSEGIFAPEITIAGTDVTATSDINVAISADYVVIKSGKVTASGESQAIYGTVKNHIKGTGWTDTAGTQGKADIAINTDGQELEEYKKVQFPAVPEPVKESTITYDLNGGTLNGETGIVTTTVDNGTVITLPAPTRDGYTFDYWEGSKYYAGDKYKVNGDHTFKAVWKTADKGGSSDSDNKGGSSKKGVNTGDEQNVAGWITMMIASVLALAALAVKRKDILHR